MSQIPTLDIRRFETDRDAFVADLGAAYREWGFCGIRGHGISDAQIQNAYQSSKDFFALPTAVKMNYQQPGTGGARGYTAFGIETAKDSKFPDLKEFWHVGREIPLDSKYAKIMTPNLWPSEVPHFKENLYGLFTALDTLGSTVLSALALHLGLPENFFVEKTNQGNSILRSIHYPPIVADEIPNVRAGAHEDINLITLLVGASAAGLEVLSNKNEWVPFTSDEDTIVVNIGDMLQRLSNHVYPSTTHRVVNPKGEGARKPRYSIPFFLHLNPDSLIKTLPQCISAENPDRYLEPITANEYLMERLREIKLV
jgi:isopenicillin N synthase-like dioxygenase